MTTERNRTPSEWRNMLEVRVRKIAGSKEAAERKESLEQIRDLAIAALAQMDRGEDIPEPEDEAPEPNDPFTPLPEDEE